MKVRPGFGLAELVTALTLLGLLGAACASVLHVQVRLLRIAAERAAGDETVRAAQTVLRAELADLGPHDVRAIAADSIALRVFRGVGIVCATQQGQSMLRYSGIRQPDADKDSVLVADGERTGTFRLVSLPGVACPHGPGEQLLGIEAAPATTVGSVILFFESGAYHLAGSALRYRRGPEGRQPLTDELLDVPMSGFFQDSTGVQVRLHGIPGAADRASAVITRIRFRNR